MCSWGRIRIALLCLNFLKDHAWYLKWLQMKHFPSVICLLNRYLRWRCLLNAGSLCLMVLSYTNFWAKSPHWTAKDTIVGVCNSGQQQDPGLFLSVSHNFVHYSCHISPLPTSYFWCANTVKCSETLPVFKTILKVSLFKVNQGHRVLWHEILLYPLSRLCLCFTIAKQQPQWQQYFLLWFYESSARKFPIHKQIRWREMSVQYQ